MAKGKPNDDLGDEKLPIKFVDVPPSVVDGKPNPAHYRARAVNINRVGEYHIHRGGSIPFNLESAMKMLMNEAALNGLDAEGLADMRTPEEKLADWAAQFKEDSDKIWEVPDRDIDLMIRTTSQMVSNAQYVLETWAKREDIPTGERMTQAQADEAGSVVREGKKMLERLDRVRRLQRYARDPNPLKSKGNEKFAWEATHTLRFMLYVNRSEMSGGVYEDHDSRVFRFGLHHAVMACAVWQAENSVQFENGKILPGVKPYTMCVLVCPPGHGKSQFAAGWLGHRICKNPSSQNAYLHANDDVAAEAVSPVAHMFSPQEASGRRRDAIYPNVNLLKKATSKGFFVRTKEKQRNPTVRAAGILTGRLGVSTDGQVLDDIVEQRDRDEPQTRERRCSRLSGTWMTRQRGTKTFTLVVGTFWHKADALMKLLDIAKRGNGIVVSVQKTGGPDTNPPFFPLWKEVYPQGELRKRYEKMNRDKHLWSCNYEANPSAEGAKLIRRLRLYDPMSLEHHEFVNNARMHVSVDPAATNREGTDKAGIIYAGIGEVTGQVVGGANDGASVYQTRLRIIDAEELHANQVEVVDRVAMYAMQRPVYQVHAEIKTGFGATADIFRDKYGLEVICHEPGNRSKEIRLKQCAGLIDDSSTAYRALVEFPGMSDGNGKIVPDPKWSWLYDEFLSFGATDRDHSVDATTQLVNYLIRSGELVAGTGEASRAIVASVIERGDPRILAAMKEAAERRTPREQASEDAEWMRADQFGGF